MRSTYGSRLKDALAHKHLSREGFEMRMKERRRICATEGRPAPAGGKRQIGKFLRDELEAPETFSREAAVVLDVNWEWLHRGRGPMTNVLEAFVTLNKTAPLAVITSAGARPYDPTATAERLQFIAKPIADRRAELAAYAVAWDRLVSSSTSPVDPERQLALARELWSRVTAILELLGVSPYKASTAFYLGVFGALVAVMPADGKGRDLSTSGGLSRN
jgi:hypothetical protein